MTALERLKELESEIQDDVYFEIPSQDARFIFKAFNVLFNLAKEKLEDDCGWLGDLEKEFDSRMSK